MFTIDVEWFKVWTKSRYPILDPDLNVFVSFYSPHFFRSGDRPEDDGYSCALVWGVFEPGAQDVIGHSALPPKPLAETHFMSRYIKEHQLVFTRGYHIILLSVLPLLKIDASQLISYVENLQHDYLNTSSKKSYSDHNPTFMIMPALDKEHSLLVTELCEIKHLQLRPFYFKNHGNNLEELLTLATPILREGRVWLCAHPENPQELRNMDAGLLEVISGYPSTQSVAMTWALCQAIVQLKLEGVFDKDYGLTNQFKAIKLY